MTRAHAGASRLANSLMITDYRRVAERAQEVRFDGVEVHSVDGYLLDTFLQPKTNHRTDDVSCIP